MESPLEVDPSRPFSARPLAGSDIGSHCLGPQGRATTTDVCRKHGISSATFYKLKAKYGGLDVSDAKRLKALEDENAKLKKSKGGCQPGAHAVRDSATVIERKTGRAVRFEITGQTRAEIWDWLANSGLGDASYLFPSRFHDRSHISTRLPTMRALVLNYPDDPCTWDLGTEYLWGDDMLVAP